MELIRRGVPAVVIATGQFVDLAKVMMRSRRVPETIAVVIAGNPEFLDEPAFDPLAAQIFADMLERLAGNG